MTPPSTFRPRDYQVKAVEEASANLRNGIRAQIIVGGTGCGKTTIFKLILQRAFEKAADAGRKSPFVIFLAHRDELLTQASERLDGEDYPIPHGIIKANAGRRRPWERVQVASVATLVNRTLAEEPSIIVIDECHRAPSKSYRTILDRYPHAAVIGLTATPIRLDGKPLGDLFQRMVLCPSVSELQSMGFLVPSRVFAPSQPDLSGVKTEKGDFHRGQLSAVMDQPRLTGDIVEHWLKHADHRRTLVFAVDRKHSEHIAEAFRARGIEAVHVDGDTDKGLRRRIIQDARDGKIPVVSNVQLFTEGTDLPVIGCVVPARPTQSLSLHLQMLGRGKRLYAGKEYSLVLDHAGNVCRHGFDDDEREWSLDGKKKRRVSPKLQVEDNVKVCPECYAVHAVMKRVCDTIVDGKPCGYVFHVAERTVETVAGELKEIQRDQLLYRVDRVSSDPGIASIQQWAMSQGWKHADATAAIRRLFAVRGEYQAITGRSAPRDLTTGQLAAEIEAAKQIRAEMSFGQERLWA